MTTIVTRAGKGASLSWDEGDANFTNLNNDKLEASDLVATSVSNTPSGSISATTVQAAINELDTEKVPLDGTGATGTWAIDITGNSATATLATTATTATTATNIADGAVSTSDKIADGVVTPAKLSEKLTLGTAVSASGTAIDFTGIPSWATKVTVLLNEVSTSGSARLRIQLGTNGGIESTGYEANTHALAASSVASIATATAGFDFHLASSDAAAARRSGTITFSLLQADTWIGVGRVTDLSTVYESTSCGKKVLAGALTQVRVSTSNGTDTFDAGTINIMWE